MNALLAHMINTYNLGFVFLHAQQAFTILEQTANLVIQLVKLVKQQQLFVLVVQDLIIYIPVISLFFILYFQFQFHFFFFQKI